MVTVIMVCTKFKFGLSTCLQRLPPEPTKMLVSWENRLPK